MPLDYTNVPQELHDIWEDLPNDEARADALLSFHGAIKKRKGVLNRTTNVQSEKQLLNKQRKEMSNYTEGLTLYAISEHELSESMEREREQLMVRANLTGRQAMAWELHMMGVTYAEIGRVMRVCRVTASQHVFAAQAKLQAAMVSCPWWGWWDVYKEELHKKHK